MPASPQHMPLVGVVTPSFNRCALTVGFLQQILQQEYLHLRVYVGDSCSSDGTPEAIAREFGSAVRVLPCLRHHYWTGATNRCVEAALEDGCEYILTINDDSVFDAGYIRRLVETAQANALPITGTTIHYVNEPGRIWAIGSFNDYDTGRLVQLCHANLWEEDILDLKSLEYIPVECLCGNGTLVHRDVYASIGLYDERHTPHYHADSEFTVRAARNGYPSAVATRARLFNRFTMEGDGPAAQKNLRYFSLRSANHIRPIIFMLWAHCPPEKRGKALLYHYEHHLARVPLRLRSMLLRAAALLDTPQEEWPDAVPGLLPPTSPPLRMAEDLVLLCQMKPALFVEACASYFFARRAGAEASYCLQQASAGKHAEAILALAHSEEARARHAPFVSPEHAFLLGSDNVSHLSANYLKSLDDAGFLFACFAYLYGRAPRRDEWKDELLSLGNAPSRDAFAWAMSERAASKSAVEDGSVPASAHKRFLGGLVLRADPVNSEEPPERAVYEGRVIPAKAHMPPPKPRSDSRLHVAFNVDVLCMAAMDTRARTGVYRSASATLAELLTMQDVAVSLFCSPQVHHGWQGAQSMWRGTAPLPPLQEFPTSAQADVAFFPYFPAAPLQPGCDLPLMLTINDLIPVMRPEWFTPEATARFRQQLRMLEAVQGVSCISHATKRDVEAMFPTLDAPCEVVHLAAAQAFTPQPGEAIAAARKTCKIPSDHEYFLAVGTLEPRKNLQRVLEAFTCFRKKHPDLKVSLASVGATGWNFDPARAGAAGMDISLDDVIFCGFVPDETMAALYSGAMCSTFVSLYEGFGLPIVESYQCATPVITATTSSMPEIAGDAAILVDPMDVQAIAGAMETMATDPQRRTMLADAALVQATQFSWAKTAQTLVAALARCAATRGPDARP